jgi:hypothetical protein
VVRRHAARLIRSPDLLGIHPALLVEPAGDADDAWTVQRVLDSLPSWVGALFP